MKKYDLFSLIIVLSTLLILGIGGLVLINFSLPMGADLQETASDLDISSEYQNASTSFMAEDSGKFADNYFFWFLVAVFIGIIMMGLYLEFEPATMILIFIIGLIVVAGAYLGGSIYDGFTEEVDYNTDTPKTNILLSSSYFPLFIFVCLIIMVVIMYNRKRGVDYQ